MRTYASSASIAAMIVALPTLVFANEWDVKVGGYYDAMVTSSGAAGGCIADFDGFDVSTSAEISFQPSITLDNGIDLGTALDLDKPPTDPSPSFAVLVFVYGMKEIVLTLSSTPGRNCYEVAKDIITDFMNSGSGGSTSSGGSGTIGASSGSGTAASTPADLRAKRAYFAYLQAQMEPGGAAWQAIGAFIKAIDDYLIHLEQPSPTAFSAVVFDIGLGYTQGINDVDLGATQSIDQDGGLGLDFSIQTPFLVDDKFRLLIGLQGFHGQSSNQTLINPAPFPRSPLGGETSYWGGGVVLGAEYNVTPQFSLSANMMVGAAWIDFSAVQGGVTVVTGNETVLALRGGLGAYYKLGQGVSLGAGLSYTYTGDYDSTTNTNAVLRTGGVNDWAATMRLRFELDFD